MATLEDDCVAVGPIEGGTDVPPHDWRTITQPPSQPSQPSIQVRPPANKRKRTSTAARDLISTTTRGVSRTYINWTEERNRCESEEAVSLDSTDSGRDDGDDIEDSTGPSTPVPNRQLTAAARKHRNAADHPDLDSTPSRPLVRVLFPNKRRRHVRAVNDAALIGFLTRAAAAFAAPMVPGSHDISLAIDDLLERYQGSITNVEMKHCLKAIVVYPNALMWNRLNSEMKDTFVEDWKEGNSC